MGKGRIGIVLCLLTAVAIILLPHFVFPQSVGDLQNEINNTQQENARLQGQAESLKTSNAALGAKIKELQAEVALLEGQDEAAKEKNKSLHDQLFDLNKKELLKRLKGAGSSKPGNSKTNTSGKKQDNSHGRKIRENP